MPQYIEQKDLAALMVGEQIERKEVLRIIARLDLDQRAASETSVQNRPNPGRTGLWERLKRKLRGRETPQSNEKPSRVSR